VACGTIVKPPGLSHCSKRNTLPPSTTRSPDDVMYQPLPSTRCKNTTTSGSIAWPSVE
jgi:hypothetical protein